MTPRLSLPLAALLLSLAATSPARAASPDAEHAAAVDSFRRGTQLVESGQLEAAISAFRDALAHEPASVGARLDLADCYEKLGSPASAWRQYATAEFHARRANDPRRDVAHASAAHLESSLLLLTLSGAPSPAEEVRVDGESVGEELLARGAIAVAPGRHHVEAVAPSKTPLAEDVVGAAGETRSIPIALVDAAPPQARAEPPPPPAPEPPPAPVAPPAPPSSSRRTWGIALGAVGLVGLVAGGVTGGIAVADKSSLVSESHDPSVGSARFYADRSNADLFANVSTTTLLAGGVLLVAGVVLYVTSPSARDSAARAPLTLVAGDTPGSVGLRF